MDYDKAIVKIPIKITRMTQWKVGVFFLFFFSFLRCCYHKSKTRLDWRFVQKPNDLVLSSCFGFLHPGATCPKNHPTTHTHPTFLGFRRNRWGLSTRFGDGCEIISILQVTESTVDWQARDPSDRTTWFSRKNMLDTHEISLLEANSQQKTLKMDGWKMNFPFWGPAHSEGRTVSFREGNFQDVILVKHFFTTWTC